MVVMVFSPNFIVGVRFGEPGIAWLPRSSTLHVKLVYTINHHFCSPVIINFCVGKVFLYLEILLSTANQITGDVACCGQ